MKEALQQLDAESDVITRLQSFDRSKWKRVRFDEMAECVTDRVDDPSSAGVDRYVGLEHLDPDSLRISRWGSPHDVQSTKLRFRSGDIVFGKRRAYQRKLAVADFDGICSAHAMVLRAKQQMIHPDFLPALCSSNAFFERAVSISVGGLSPTINWRDLAKETFLIPSYREQERIAEIFGELETVRQNLGRAYDHALELRDLDFSERLMISGPDTSKLEQEGNQWVPAHMACESIVSGYTPKEMTEGCGEVRFLKVYNLTHDGSLDADNRPVFISRQTHEGELRRSAVKPGDVLTNIVGPPLGKVSIVPTSVPEANINQAIVAFRPKTGVSSRLISAYLLREQTRRWLYSRGKKTSGQLNITRTTCRNMPFPSVLLNPREAPIIEQALLRNDVMIEAIQGHTHRVNEMKAALSQLFFGEVRNV